MADKSFKLDPHRALKLVPSLCEDGIFILCRTDDVDANLPLESIRKTDLKKYSILFYFDIISQKITQLRGTYFKGDDSSRNWFVAQSAGSGQARYPFYFKTEEAVA